MTVSKSSPRFQARHNGSAVLVLTGTLSVLAGPEGPVLALVRVLTAYGQRVTVDADEITFSSGEPVRWDLGNA